MHHLVRVVPPFHYELSHGQLGLYELVKVSCYGVHFLVYFRRPFLGHDDHGGVDAGNDRAIRSNKRGPDVHDSILLHGLLDLNF